MALWVLWHRKLSWREALTHSRRRWFVSASTLAEAISIAKHFDFEPEEHGGYLHNIYRENGCPPVWL